jgi:DNA-binding NarL/FixJ family response regulator
MRWRDDSAATSASPSIVIVSDVLLYREGLAASVARDGRAKVIALATTRDTRSVLSCHHPDAILIDTGASDCLELARELRGSLPHMPIVGFGISGGEQRCVEFAEAGISAFIDAEASIEALVDAVIAALKGELICSARVSALMRERLARLAAGSVKTSTLTRREQEIALLVGQGLSNKEIANDLHIGTSTVKNHIHNILEKLNVRRRAAIVLELVL